ncbi:MAG: nucleotidyltransferase domain-containing protein [Acidimicrobiales bacterium]
MAPGGGRPAGGRGLKIDARHVVARRQAERRALVGRAEGFAAALDADLKVLAIVVFGSVARGDFNLWSDVDVLVVLGEVDDRRVGEVRSAGREVGLVEPVVWSAAQLRAQLARHDPIAIESVERGIWLVGAAADLVRTQ